VFFRDRKITLHSNDKYEIRSEGNKRILIVNDVGYDDEAKFTCDAHGCRSTAKLIVSGKATSINYGLSCNYAMIPNRPILHNVFSNSSLSDFKIFNSSPNANKRYKAKCLLHINEFADYVSKHLFNLIGLALFHLNPLLVL